MPPQDFTKLADGVMTTAVGTFGEIVRYIPKNENEYSIRGIFDKLFEQVDPDTEQIVASNQPVIGFRESDLQRTPEKGDRIIIRGKTYRVIDSQEDGVAGVRLLLHEVENG
jgi:hypothetical protein